MSKTRNTASLFDEDFEVTYEEEVPFTYTFDTKPESPSVLDETVLIDSASYKARVSPRKKSTSQEDGSYRFSSYENEYDDDSDDSQYKDNESNQGYDDDYEYDRDSRSRRRIPASSAPRVSFRPKRAPKYGTKSIYRAARSVVRIVSLLITAGTLGILAYNFWRGAAPYGDPQTILAEKNYTLLSYAAIAAIFLLFEVIAFFWSMTKMRIREGRTVYKEDTGRGLFSFIFIYISSYLSFLLCSFLPETLGSYAVLNGIKGALDVYGSLHNVLLGLCLAGVISCLIRRHMI